MADTADLSVHDAPRTIYLKDYIPPAYLVDVVDLHFDLDEEATTVRSRLVMRRNEAAQAGEAALVLYGSHQELLSIKLNGNALNGSEYQVTDEQLSVQDVPEQFTLEIESRINPKANTALEGLYLSSGLLTTQCEAEGFRRITYFPDRPDVMARFTVTLEADKEKFPVLLANGNLVDSGEHDDGRHWARWEDPSLKPSYLFAVVAGPLMYQEDSFTTMSGRKVILRLYVEEENINKCDHAMASLKQAMHWDEDVYGREYDLDIYMIVAVNDFNMGAMENKGLNVFNASCVLASPETATDADYYTIQSIIGHEYFHNWSGNRVTCRDWFQLSLKEGFTVFRDQEFSADLNSRGVKRIDDVNVLRLHQFAQDASPMAHPVRPDHYIEINNFYTVTVYNKGAEVVRMIRNLVGAEGFRKGTDLYFARHDGQAVTTDDFVRAMEDANGIDLIQFKRWYDQAGTPEITLIEDYDAANNTFQLTLQQHTPATPGQDVKQPFHIPLSIGLIDSQGNDMPLQLADKAAESITTMTLSLTKAEQVFTFHAVPEKPLVSIGRGFSAPVKFKRNLSDSELAFLLAHDSDEFNRWDAGQQLAMTNLLTLIDDYQHKRKLHLPDEVIEAYRKALTQPQLDKALVARIMTLPSESYIADQMAVVDVEAIHATREFMRHTLAQALRNELLQTYQANQSTVAYRFHADDMAQRSLKNKALAYLMSLADDGLYQLCVEQHRQGDNMSEVMAALSLLADVDGPAREEALADFYTRWQHDPQVVEKWLAIQAGSSLPNTLAKVQALMQHPAFSMQNPNKVRSLIGRFCAGNPVNFHAADGAGYRFLADRVLELDALNPSIAARLVQTLSRWRRYDPERQALMREQLERIVARDGLSNDVYEIASRSLEG
ncbi:MAG: aminopeptidase N [Gammaproteobacteria bacterium]|nr:aminopeptidase N [Gammaproteobacteria bacterium]